MVVSFLLAINNLHVPNMALAMESIKNVATESDKEVEFAKPATPEQQKEIAKNLYDAVKKYWDKRSNTGIVVQKDMWRTNQIIQI